MSAPWTTMISDCSVGPGMADLTLSVIGGRTSQVLEASEIGVSWEENQPSTLIADLALDAVTALYDPVSNVEGAWVNWYGNAFDPWAGTEVTIDGGTSQSVLQVSFEDFSNYMGSRLLPPSQKKITGCAGGVVDVLLKYAEMPDTLWLDSFDYENSGDLISFTLNGQTMRDALQQVASDSGQFWRMDGRTLVWRAAMGSDLRRSVQLNEGVEIAAVRPTWDIGAVVNDVTVVPDKAVYAARYARRVVDVASARQIFLRQGAITASDAVRPSAIRTIGKNSLAASARLGRTLSLDLVNVNECFSRFRVSDDIRVVIPSYNLAVDVHVLQLNYVLSTGLLTLVGAITS